MKLWPRVWCLVFLTHGVYSFISTTVDKTQLCRRAKIKRDGDKTEKKVNVM